MVMTDPWRIDNRILYQSTLFPKFWYWAVQESIHHLKTLLVTCNHKNFCDINDMTTPYIWHLTWQQAWLLSIVSVSVSHKFLKIERWNKANFSFNSQGRTGIALDYRECVSGMVIHNPKLDSFSALTDYCILDCCWSCTMNFLTFAMMGRLTMSQYSSLLLIEW